MLKITQASPSAALWPSALGLWSGSSTRKFFLLLPCVQPLPGTIYSFPQGPPTVSGSCLLLFFVSVSLCCQALPFIWPICFLLILTGKQLMNHRCTVLFLLKGPVSTCDHGRKMPCPKFSNFVQICPICGHSQESA